MLAEFEDDISKVKIIPSSGGVFEVMVDEQLIFSKKAMGRHADYDEILTALRQVSPDG